MKLLQELFGRNKTNITSESRIIFEGLSLKVGREAGRWPPRRGHVTLTNCLVSV